MAELRAVTRLARSAQWLRRTLFAGFLALFPLAATWWVLSRVLAFLDGIIGKYVTKAKIPGLGIALLFVLLLLAGMMVTSFFGRRLLALNEALMARIPFARTIYSGAKQIVEALSPEARKGFKRVVMVEYPRRGLWTIGLVTREGTPEMNERTGERVSHVLLPHTPNATGGVLIQVPEKDLLTLHMSIEDGLKLIVSCGLVVPGEASATVGDQAS